MRGDEDPDFTLPAVESTRAEREPIFEQMIHEGLVVEFTVLPEQLPLWSRDRG